jgi:hypothetical protein
MDGTLTMLRIFWDEKRDLERWAGFDRAEVAAKYPEVLKAWDDYVLAGKLLNAVLQGVAPHDQSRPL